MSDKTTPRILQGFCELLPQDQLLFDSLTEKISNTYKKYGFFSIDTPVLEFSEVLLAKAGGETEKQIYRFNHYDNDLSMRFDLTVPLARYVAQHSQDLVFPFRRCQISKVFRGERPQKGRFREFYQCDADVIGSETLDISYDAEMTSLIYDVMKSLDLGDFVIRVNNRKILSGFFGYLGLSDKITEILRVIDKLEKMGLDKVKAELKEVGADDKQISEILDFVSISGSNSEKVEALKKIDAGELYSTGVEELDTVIKTAVQLGTNEKNLRIDLSIARGLDYYTGTVYETTLIGHENFGSVCSGGRYDNLTGYYSDKVMPGVGISIGITRLFSLLKENEMLGSFTKTVKSAVVLPMDKERYAYAAKVVSEVRRAGIRCDVFWSDKSGKAKFKYASRIDADYALAVGETEETNNTVTVKNLGTGEQVEVALDKVAEMIR